MRKYPLLMLYLGSLIISIITASCGLESQITKCPVGSSFDMRRGKCIASNGTPVGPQTGGSGSTDPNTPAANADPAKQDPAKDPAKQDPVLSSAVTFMLTGTANDFNSQLNPIRIAQGGTITFVNKTGNATLQVHSGSPSCNHSLIVANDGSYPCVLTMGFVNSASGAASTVYQHQSTPQRNIYITTKASGF